MDIKRKGLYFIIFMVSIGLGMGIRSVIASLTFSGNAVSGDGAVSITAGGSDQNVSITPSGSGFTLLSGNTGIGTSTPGYLLSVATTSNIFNVSSSGAVGFRNVFYLFPTSQGSTSTVLTNDGSGGLSWGSASGGWTRTGTTLFPATSTDSVAIGTSTAATLFSIATTSPIFHVTTAGLVGIGTASPVAKVAVKDAGSTGVVNIGQLNGSSAFSGIAFTTSTSAQLTAGNYSLIGEGINTILSRPSGGIIDFREANTSQMSIASGGAVTMLGPSLSVGSGTGSGISGVALTMTFADTNQHALDLKNSNVDAFHLITATDYIFGTLTGFPITIRTNNTDRITIASSTGNMGLGTASPSSSIHVLRASSTIRIGNGASNTSGCIEVGNSDGSAGLNYITVLSGTMTVTTTKPAACQ